MHPGLLARVLYFSRLIQSASVFRVYVALLTHTIIDQIYIFSHTRLFCYVLQLTLRKLWNIENRMLYDPLPADLKLAWWSLDLSHQSVPDNGHRPG